MVCSIPASIVRYTDVIITMRCLHVGIYDLENLCLSYVSGYFFDYYYVQVVYYINVSTYYVCILYGSLEHLDIYPNSVICSCLSHIISVNIDYEVVSMG